MSVSPRVLLVDDNRPLVENLKEVLETEGVRAEIAADGEEALSRLEEAPFDAVITDMRMPGMDGLQVLREIRRRWPETPVIVMTAYARDSLAEEARAEGALGVLAKPLDLAHLTDLVARLAPPQSAILLVEDDDDLRGNLVEALWEEAGVVPVAVPGVGAAKRAISRLEFPVAIVDMRLPDGEGPEVAAALLERMGAGRCHVIFTTGFGGELEETLRTLLATPSVRLLEKPFSPDRLLTLVKEAV